MTKIKRRVFGALEIENARNLTLQQLSETFIPTMLYEQLLRSPKNQILFGSRGQGKTALFRMLSFPGMRMLSRRYPAIGKIISDKSLFGIYLPTKLEWVQSLSSQLGGNGVDTRTAFLWKLNLSSCIAFLETVKACFDEYCDDGNRLYCERQFCKKVSCEWRLGTDCHTVAEVLDMLETIGYEWQTTLAICKITESSLPRKRTPHSETFAVFLNAAFLPLRRGIEILSMLLGIRKNAAWFLCVDEAEYMMVEHQQIINSFMRGAPGNLFVKIATMPFSYNSLETGIADAPVVAGHDFEFLHMDNGGAEVMNEAKKMERCLGGRHDSEFVFCEMLFRRVAHEYFQAEKSKESLLLRVFGESELLDADVAADWCAGSQYLSLLKKYATPQLYERAQDLLGQNNKTKFMNEVGRKVRGTLVLRESGTHLGGHRKSHLYSGAKMIVKCAEGNPRRLISILKSLIVENVNGKMPRVKPTCQEDALVGIASNFLNQIRSYQNVGTEMYKMVQSVGEYLKKDLYSNPLSGDVKMSFSVGDLDSRNDGKMADVLKMAIAYGVIKPNDLTKINYGNGSSLAGDYHLSYVFCPLFRLQPRKGHSVDLERMLKEDPKHVRRAKRRRKVVAFSSQLLLDLK